MPDISGFLWRHRVDMTSFWRHRMILTPFWRHPAIRHRRPSPGHHFCIPLEQLYINIDLHYFIPQLSLRPPYPVNKAYQLPFIQCCFIAICDCIKPSQTHGPISGWSPLPVPAWDGKPPSLLWAISHCWVCDCLIQTHNSNETALYGRELICLIYGVWWP